MCLCFFYLVHFAKKGLAGHAGMQTRLDLTTPNTDTHTYRNVEGKERERNNVTAHPIRSYQLRLINYSTRPGLQEGSRLIYIFFFSQRP